MAQDAGGTYVLVCTGTDPNEQERNDATTHLSKFLTECGYAGTDADFKTWGQSDLVGILQRFPSLALRINGNGAVDFQPHTVWSSQAEMSKPFKVGAKQQGFIDSVQEQLRRADGPVHVRVRGEAGIGKTRLILETTRPDDLRPLVIYCDLPTKVDGALMKALLNDNPEIAAIVIVDECDLENRTRIWNQLQNKSPRIKLVTIYNDIDEPAGTTIVQDASPLEDEKIAQIIEEYDVPSDHARRWAAEYCDGSPRVAHVIGRNLKNNPDDILKQPDTVNVWDRYVAGEDKLDSEDVQQRRVALRHIALFKRFGYGGSVSGRGEGSGEARGAGQSTDHLGKI